MKGTYIKPTFVCLIALSLIVPAAGFLEFQPDVVSGHAPSLRGIDIPRKETRVDPDVNDHTFGSVYDSTYANVDNQKPWGHDTPFTSVWFYSFLKVDDVCRVQSSNVELDLYKHNGIVDPRCTEDNQYGMIHGFHCLQKIRVSEGHQPFKFVAVVGGEKFRHALVRCLETTLGIRKMVESTRDFLDINGFDGVEYYVPSIENEVTYTGINALYGSLRDSGIKTSLQVQWNPAGIHKLKDAILLANWFRPRFFEFTVNNLYTAPMAALSSTDAKNCMEDFNRMIKELGIDTNKVFATLPSYAMKWGGVSKGGFGQGARKGWAASVDNRYRIGSEPYKNLYNNWYLEKFTERIYDPISWSTYWFSPELQELVSFEGYYSMVEKAHHLTHIFGYKAVVLQQDLDDMNGMLSMGILNGIFDLNLVGTPQKVQNFNHAVKDHSSERIRNDVMNLYNKVKASLPKDALEF